MKLYEKIDPATGTEYIGEIEAGDLPGGGSLPEGTVDGNTLRWNNTDVAWEENSDINIGKQIYEPIILKKSIIQNGNETSETITTIQGTSENGLYTEIKTNQDVYPLSEQSYIRSLCNLILLICQFNDYTNNPTYQDYGNSKINILKNKIELIIDQYIYDSGYEHTTNTITIDKDKVGMSCLAGTGDRPLLADENGNIEAGSADILTNSHTHTNKTFLDGLIEFGMDAGDVAEGNHGHNHNDLNSLQGGATGEYYHLTQTELTDLGTAISNSHYHANKTLLDNIIDSGAGNEFLADDGTYKAAGLAYFEESRSVASPNATVPAHQLTPKGEENNIDAVISPKGTGSILAQIPDGYVGGGIKRGSNCIDLQFERTINSQVPSAPSSVIIGGKNSKISGTAGYNVILCASGATISTNGTYTSWYNSIIGGYDNEIKYGGCNIILGGESNSIIESSGNTSTWSGIIGGRDNIITSSPSSVIAGGESNEMYKSASSFIGGSHYAKTTQMSQHAHATWRFAATGDAQRSVRMFMGNTLETNYYRLKTAAKNKDLELSEFVIGKYSTWFCKLKISGVRRTTGAIDHYCSEHNFMLMKENSIPFLYDFDPPNGLYVNEIMSSQQNGSSVGLALSFVNKYGTHFLAIDMATTETGWQFVAHLETVETFASSLI